MNQPFNILGKLVSGFAGGLSKGAEVREQPSTGSFGIAMSPRRRRLQVAFWAGCGLGMVFLMGCLAIWLGERGRKVPITLAPTKAVNVPSVSRRSGRAELYIDRNVTPWAWQSIVLHHSATSGGSTSSFDRFHRTEKGWRSLGYHFVIGNGHQMRDGLVEAGPRWKRQQSGAHANSRKYNRNGIGICLVGNFERAEPTPRQLKATIKLVRELCRRFQIPLSHVYGHGQIRGGGSTACPGKFLSVTAIVDGVKARGS